MDITLVKVSRIQNKWAVLCLSLTWRFLQHSVGLRESVSSSVSVGLDNTPCEIEFHLYCLFSHPAGAIVASLPLLWKCLVLIWSVCTCSFWSKCSSPSPSTCSISQFRCFLLRENFHPPLHINGILLVVPIPGSKARWVNVLPLLWTDIMTMFKCIPFYTTV